MGSETLSPPQSPPRWDEIIAACLWLRLPTRTALFWTQHGKTLAPFVWLWLAEIGFCLTSLCEVNAPFSSSAPCTRSCLCSATEAPLNLLLLLYKLASSSPSHKLGFEPATPFHGPPLCSPHFSLSIPVRSDASQCSAPATTSQLTPLGQSSVSAQLSSSCTAMLCRTRMGIPCFSPHGFALRCAVSAGPLYQAIWIALHDCSVLIAISHSTKLRVRRTFHQR